MREIERDERVLVQDRDLTMLIPRGRHCHPGELLQAHRLAKPLCDFAKKNLVILWDGTPI